jgi:hypothetical protein
MLADLYTLANFPGGLPSSVPASPTAEKPCRYGIAAASAAAASASLLDRSNDRMRDASTGDSAMARARPP